MAGDFLSDHRSHAAPDESEVHAGHDGRPSVYKAHGRTHGLHEARLALSLQKTLRIGLAVYKPEPVYGPQMPIELLSRVLIEEQLEVFLRADLLVVATMRARVGPLPPLGAMEDLRTALAFDPQPGRYIPADRGLDTGLRAFVPGHGAPFSLRERIACRSGHEITQIPGFKGGDIGRLTPKQADLGSLGHPFGRGPDPGIRQ